MDFEHSVRILVEELVRQVEAALRAQLEARMLGASAPRRVAAAPRSGAPSPPRRKRGRPPTGAPPVPHAADTLMDRVFAFVEDNQDRIGDDDKPIRIDRAMIAERLAIEPELADAVLDHLVSARKLQRAGGRRGGHYTTSGRTARRGKPKGTVMADIARQVVEGLARRMADENDSGTSSGG